jgi:fibronectin type 3 domain-containing protein
MSRCPQKVAAALVGLALMVTTTASAGAQGRPEGEPGFARAQDAIDRLGERLPAAAQANGMTVAEFRSVVLSDSTVAVNGAGELAYFDEIAPGEVDITGEAISAAPPVTDLVFQLASLPGADKTIYLDFDGHITQDTSWNSSYGVATIVSPPYDLDGDPNSWTAQELDIIRRSFIKVSEDFAPWNINVTTIDPGVDALMRFGTGDTQWGARVVITDDTFANCGCGGHAFIGAFDDAVDEPTYVYNSSFKGVSEAITHEVGHMLNLAHDGTTTANYYTGHPGTGSTGWAPIMGAAYYQPVSQWSQQEYFGANNFDASANFGRGGDDIAIISSLSNGNGFGPRIDDFGNSAANATALIGSSPTVAGLINARTDIDVFSFSTNGGDIRLETSPDSAYANLDIEMTLRDSAGTIVARANPISELSAVIVVTVSAGTYTVEIDGVGVGNPAVDPPSGYTDYGSLGRYVLTGSLGETPPPDTEAPSIPSGLDADVGDGSVQLSWTANTEADLAGYTVYRSETGQAPVAIATVSNVSPVYSDTPESSGSYIYSVAAVDASGNESARSATVTAVVEASLRSVAVSDLAVYGTVQGNYTNTQVADGVSQVITEVGSGGKPRLRHDRLEHRWEIPATSGTQTLTVVARVADGGDADNGVSVEWSSNQNNWIPLGTIASGAMTTNTWSIGTSTGTVWVRMVDTNRGSRQESFDRVEIDELRLDGVEVGDATEILITQFSIGTQSAGKGRQHGTATIVVRNDLGQAIAGATITVNFGGSFSETLTGTTNSSGSVSFVTSQSTKRPAVQACATAVEGANLPYNGGTTCRMN